MDQKQQLWAKAIVFALGALFYVGLYAVILFETFRATTH